MDEPQNAERLRRRGSVLAQLSDGTVVLQRSHILYSKFLNSIGMSDSVQVCHMDDLIRLTSQVAGHGSPGSRSRSGIYLHLRDGYIVKPVEKVALFEKERKAYDFINSENDEVTQKLRKFLPQYYGVRKLCIDKKEVNALALENMTHGLPKPCVLDVKIGRQTWEPDAPEEKIEVEKAKYIKCRRAFGFCIPGLQYFLEVGAEFEVKKHGKEYGKTLDKNGAIDALKAFVSWDPQCSRILILQFLCQLQQIFEWFQGQDRYYFYSSSLLFVYDAKELKSLRSHLMSKGADKSDSYSAQIFKTIENCLSNYYSFKEEDDTVKRMEYLSKASCCLTVDKLITSADVKMIDMAHFIVKDDKSLDSNYLEGLTRLIDIFEELLDDANKRLGIVYIP